MTSMATTDQEFGISARAEGLRMVRTRHALVVSPDRMVARRCREAAIAHGFEVDFADCGVDALNLARQTLPDLVLLDLELRDVHGLELVNWLHSSPELQSVPVIAIAAFAAQPTDPRTQGVLTVLRKPLRAADLDRWLDREAVERRE